MDRLLRQRAEVVGAVCVLPAEGAPLLAARGRWLLEPAVAARDVPGFACSAMDGYAVRAQEVGPGGALRVGRTLYAGEEPGAPIERGEATRIYTGAPLPPGADAVVREEATTERGGIVTLRDAVRPGENVRQAGEDVRRGQVALDRGTWLGPRQLAFLTSVGVERVAVARRPRVTVISTGDEIVLGRIADSNGTALCDQLRGLAADVDARQVGDDLDAITAALREALRTSDAVITVGGVSVGARDLVPAAVERLGGDVRLHGVAMKPGKPFLFALFATMGEKPLFGLPGSPSACLVAFEVFARPALLRMSGAGRCQRRALRVALAEPIAGRPGRSRLVWARLEEDGRARPIGRDAAQIRGPALADALLYVPEGTGPLDEGAVVEAWLLEDDAS